MKLRVRGGRPLQGTVRVPGDKSISHRALMFGAIADGVSRVEGFLPAEDCLATVRVLRGLGVAIHREDDTTLIVEGVGLRGLREPEDVLDCGGSGTTMRLLCGILAGQPFTSVLTGNAALRRRPMARVADPLRAMGATVLGRAGGNLPPLTVTGGALHGAEHRLSVASAQVKSCLLLAGLFAEGATTVVEPAPSRDHTERMLRAMGVPVSCEGTRVTVTPGQPRAVDTVVPGDVSSAAFLLVAATLVQGSRLTVEDVGVNRTRIGLLEVLLRAGAFLATSKPGERNHEPVADLTARTSPLVGMAVGGDLVPRMIDEFPVLAVAATQAYGRTDVRDAAELRVKESDRVATVAQELARMGARIEERPDGFVIDGPARLHGAQVDCHLDHRLAMSLAVAALVAEGETEIDGAECIADSFPGFVETLRSVGVDVDELP